MDASTQTASSHYPDRRDMWIQASLVKPFSTNIKIGEHSIKMGTSRTLSNKRKHPRKKNMSVSLATTTSLLSASKPETKDVGTEPLDPKGFKEALDKTRAVINKKLLKRCPVPPSKLKRKNKINPVNLPMILALYKKEKIMKNNIPTPSSPKPQYSNFDDNDNLVLNLSEGEKEEIDNMIMDVNNNLNK
ncbi:uncharacterized protein LOC127285384 [Leptopilina boulardi]|uniref:uncharacterized protein LOC127285384 n=1 Tax=Leptopilina boulardi TaxID=63433 RepID=UPI0021F51487|nr:uncharacterized protein LOC127285384 [Leptopilina boulardi]